MINEHLSEEEMKSHDKEKDDTTIDRITTSIIDTSHKTTGNGNRKYRITTSVLVIRFNPNYKNVINILS